MSDVKSAIGYAVYAPERDTFLGRNGVWYSDVRLATIYAEPRAAKMAGGRAETTFRKSVVEVRLTALPHSLEQAKADASKPADPDPAAKPGLTKPTSPAGPKPGTKAA